MPSVQKSHFRQVHLFQRCFSVKIHNLNVTMADPAQTPQVATSDLGLYVFVKVPGMLGICGLTITSKLSNLNRIALRKAQIVYSFGFSGCNRLKVKGYTRHFCQRETIFSIFSRHFCQREIIFVTSCLLPCTMESF